MSFRIHKSLIKLYSFPPFLLPARFHFVVLFFILKLTFFTSFFLCSDFQTQWVCSSRKSSPKDSRVIIAKECGTSVPHGLLCINYVEEKTLQPCYLHTLTSPRVWFRDCILPIAKGTFTFKFLDSHPFLAAFSSPQDSVLFSSAQECLVLFFSHQKYSSSHRFFSPWSGVWGSKIRTGSWSRSDYSSFFSSRFDLCV